MIIDSKPGVASGLLIYYSDNTSIELRPESFKFMQQFDIKRKWDIEKFKLEIIKEIIIYKNDKIEFIIK
jgi:hypothetical protein